MLVWNEAVFYEYTLNICNSVSFFVMIVMFESVVLEEATMEIIWTNKETNIGWRKSYKKKPQVLNSSSLCWLTEEKTLFKKPTLEIIL